MNAQDKSANVTALSGEELATFINNLAAAIAIREKRYDVVVVRDSDPLHTLYVFPIETAVQEIEKRGIKPENGEVALANSYTAWGDMRDQIMQAFEREQNKNHENNP